MYGNGDISTDSDVTMIAARFLPILRDTSGASTSAIPAEAKYGSCM